jgi:hypothetical protein
MPDSRADTATAESFVHPSWRWRIGADYKRSFLNKQCQMLSFCRFVHYAIVRIVEIAQSGLRNKFAKSGIVRNVIRRAVAATIWR